MRRIVAYGLTSLLLSAPAGAQSLPPEGGQGDESDIREGVDLLSEGAQRLLRGLMGEVEPRMRDLAEALNGFDFDGIGIAVDHLPTEFIAVLFFESRDDGAAKFLILIC